MILSRADLFAFCLHRLHMHARMPQGRLCTTSRMCDSEEIARESAGMQQYLPSSAGTPHDCPPGECLHMNTINTGIASIDKDAPLPAMMAGIAFFQ